MTERVTGDSAMHPEFIQISPEECLEKLKDASLSDAERRHCILEAEALKFAGDEVSQLSALLREYIESHRYSRDPEDFLAVGSAIRKYAGTMHAADLPALGAILEPGDRAAVSPAIELEVAKMIVRKLVANPPAKPDPYPELSGRLAEVAATYLNDRLIPRERCGAIALNVILGLALLASDKLQEIVRKIRDLKSAWFRELVGRRARQTLREIEGEHAISPSIQCLEGLISQFDRAREVEHGRTRTE